MHWWMGGKIERWRDGKIETQKRQRERERESERVFGEVTTRVLFLFLWSQVHVTFCDSVIRFSSTLGVRST